MSDQIGGAVSSITEQAATAQNQAEETAVASQDTERLVNNLQDEVDAVSAEMQNAFAELSGRLRDQVARTSERLHATEWSGRSRDALVAYDQELNSTANRFMESSDQGMAQFRTELMNFITQFYGQVQGEFRSAMAEIEAKYAEASRAAQTYADNLVEMDNSTITY